MRDAREKEVATTTLEVLSLGCGDMRRLHWAVLEEEEVIVGCGETLTYEFVEMVGHSGRNVEQMLMDICSPKEVRDLYQCGRWMRASLR